MQQLYSGCAVRWLCAQQCFHLLSHKHVIPASSRSLTHSTAHSLQQRCVGHFRTPTYIPSTVSCCHMHAHVKQHRSWAPGANCLALFGCPAAFVQGGTVRVGLWALAWSTQYDIHGADRGKGGCFRKPSVVCVGVLTQRCNTPLLGVLYSGGVIGVTFPAIHFWNQTALGDQPLSFWVIESLFWCCPVTLFAGPVTLSPHCTGPLRSL